MFDLYSSVRPNGHKVVILLEELGLPYRFRPVDLSKDEQKTPEFLALNPNGKVPVLVDPDGAGPDKRLVLSESGAILIYLAEKAGSPLLPSHGPDRAKVIEWLMFQMSGIGPVFGRLFYFSLMAPAPHSAVEVMFRHEADRLVSVIEGRLAKNTYIAGEEYSIADIALYPWMDMCERLKIDLSFAQSMSRWRKTLSRRPGVEAGMRVASDLFETLEKED